MTDATPTRADGKLTVALISEVFWEPDGASACKAAAGRGGRPRRRPRRPARAPAQSVAARHEGAARRRRGGRWTGSERAPRRRRRRRPASVWWAASSTGTRPRAPDEPGPGLRRAAASCRRPTRSCTCPRSRASGRRATTSRGPSRRADRRVRACRSASSSARTTTARRGRHLLGAQGAMAVIVAARHRGADATSAGSPSSAPTRIRLRYVLSVNRPHPEDGVLLGGPSVAYDPNGSCSSRRPTPGAGHHRREGRDGCASRLPGLPADPRAPLRRCVGRDRRTRRLGRAAALGQAEPAGAICVSPMKMRIS